MVVKNKRQTLLRPLQVFSPPFTFLSLTSYRLQLIPTSFFPLPPSLFLSSLYAMHFSAFFVLLPVLFSTSEGIALRHRLRPRRKSRCTYSPIPEVHHVSVATIPCVTLFLTDVASLARVIHDTQDTPDSGSASNSSTSLSDAVFPLGRGLLAWTTVEGEVDALPISDSTFRPIHDMGRLSHNTVMSQGINPKLAM